MIFVGCKFIFIGEIWGFCLENVEFGMEFLFEGLVVFRVLIGGINFLGFGTEWVLFVGKVFK